MATIVNSTPNATIKLPATKYTIKKSMPPAFEYEIHIKCKQCSNFVGSLRSEIRCETCKTMIKTSNSDYFVYIPVEKQLEHAIKNNINEILSFYAIDRQPNCMTDIFDSKIFMQIKDKYAGYIVLPLIVNTDGANCKKKISLDDTMCSRLATAIDKIQSNKCFDFCSSFWYKKTKYERFFLPVLTRTP